MKLTAIILARSGSKRLPGKNYKVRLTPDETLLQRSIRKALKITSEVYVSSDSAEVLIGAEEIGAVGVISPHHEDKSTSVDAVLFVIEKMKIEGTVLLMQLSSPFVEISEIERAIEEYSGQPIFAVKESLQVNWAWRENSPIFPEFAGVRSQDLPPAFIPCGAFYLIEAEKLRVSKDFFAGARPFVIPKEQAFDIDTPFDLEIARAIYKLSQGSKNQEKE